MRGKLGVAIAASLAFGLVGCGDLSTESTGASGSSEVAEGFDVEQCSEQVGPFLTKLQELDSRLGVGLSFDSYSTHVSDIKVVYDRIPIDDLESGCLNDVAVPSENAFNNYVRAYNAWNDCIGDTYCEMSSVEPKMQTKWASATTKLERVASELEE